MSEAQHQQSPYRVGAEATVDVVVTTTNEIDGYAVTRYLGIVIDISERKRAEEASELFLRAFAGRWNVRLLVVDLFGAGAPSPAARGSNGGVPAVPEQVRRLQALENLADGHVVNRIVVPDDEKQLAKVALDRMMALS